MMPSPRTRGRALRHLVVLMAAAAALFFLFLGRDGLTDPDESAYAESVREMAGQGQWLVPHLLGRPLLDKPILFYWLMGASFRLLGEGEFSARLPSALAALVGLWAVYRLGWLVHGSARAGLLSALTLGTSLMYAVMARAAVTDMILTTLCTLAVVLYLETLENPAARFLPIAGAACVGLAVLTKGPVGFVIPALALGPYLAATGSLRRVRELRPAAGGCVFAAVAVPWYAAISWHRPDLVKGFFASGNLGRFLEAEHRPQPPVYYLVVLLVGFLPWSAFLPGALARALRSGDHQGGNPRLRLLPALWLCGLLVFFTLAASKLPSYILPAFPAAAVLASGTLVRWFEPLPEGKAPPGIGAMVFLVLLAASILVYIWRTQNLGSIPLGFKTALLPIGLAGFLGCLFALGTLLARRARLSFFLLAAGNMVLVPSLLFFGFPLLDEWKSSRRAAELIAPLLRPSDGVLLYRQHDPGFAYYLKRIPDQVEREEDLVERFSSPRRLYGLMGRDRYGKLRARRPSLPLYLLGVVGHTVVVTNVPPGGLP
jgi:4-amino-4-deoxy-L-arabinose transferase-like glycosyltransferase